MNLNFIVVFILLSTLSIVNTIPHNFIKEKLDLFHVLHYHTSSTLSPDPIVPEETNRFTVSRTIGKDITASTPLLIEFGDLKLTWL